MSTSSFMGLRTRSIAVDDVSSLADERLLRMVETRDERHARALLYGQRSGSVGRAMPRHLQHTVQHCTDPFNNETAPGADTPEAV